MEGATKSVLVGITPSDVQIGLVVFHKADQYRKLVIVGTDEERTEIRSYTGSYEKQAILIPEVKREVTVRYVNHITGLFEKQTIQISELLMEKFIVK